MTHYQDDSTALHTDLYQINMAQTYWKDGKHNRKAVFELFFRKQPFGNGFAVFAGLERVIDYLKEFRFSDSDLDYLEQELGYEKEFIAYLRDLRFTGDLYSMQEGELVFGTEPIIRVEAPLAQAQLIETALLNIVNYQTLIATKAARIMHVLDEGDTAMEFGSRRAQEMDAAIWGTRAAFIGGFHATSNVRAGKKFGIPVAGTHAHALVQAYRDEYEAFRKYAETHVDCTFLVDTYDTLKSGVPNAIRVAKEMGDKIRFNAIRLDSGDLAYLSKRAREMLDEAGFTETKITASNDLDEETIGALKAQGAKITNWGIGTKLITAFDQPALGAVYKIVSIEDDNGDMVDTIKISANPEKVSTPGLKRVYRIINRASQKSEGDYIALKDEKPEEAERLKMFHPTYPYISKFVTDFEAKELQVPVFQNGKLVYKLPSLEESRDYVKHSLTFLWDEYKRTHNPEAYPVDLSTACWNNKMELIERIKSQLEEK
ncbi:nicotinate phosphoribosyltransferase [Terribacillus saccharophilus]|uniref:Nicotinate phosphoribosyltransferase n=1 Tax=Terribacillus saccharophilus TaxID=361277 RepID=A0A268AB32_9BACI|nr:nicotinate phosphoribosyltransferase [Terribacillus saccharophilus]PAD21259.1 nicotinate phosphoribosyltransferase [Terribacillus saccharophilus]PAF17042.1 nicotinate phosphoribosyltransferase [Terribacillus saccharophilus]PAF21113.1 nicotinate phosphoribosyltransferase [Terribacillus saccharophilus]PAF36058.1 nicotinate phosphoribosyltransferase [Terribacillus saccharophilus]